MPIGLGKAEQLIVKITGKDNFSKTFDKAGTKMDRLKSKLRGVAVGAAAAGAGVAIGLGVKAVTAAAKFEKGMANVSTLVDTSTESMGKMGDQVKEIAKRVPVDIEDLTDALYQVRSAGIDAASAMGVLETSGKLAVAGLSTTEEATNLLTTAINAFGLQGRDSSEVADILFKTVKAGKTTVAELSQSFGKMAGNAKAANIIFEDAQAATASLTALTGKTSEAQNALAQVFLELTVTGGKLDTALQDQGKSLEWLNEAIGEEGLVDGMKTAMETMGLTETEFKNLFSSAEGGTAVFQLLTDAYKINSEAGTEMLTGSNKLNEAFKKQNETADAQFKLLKNQLNVVLADLGTKILPIVLEVVKLIPPAVEKMTGAFDWLVDKLSDVFVWGNKVINVLNRIPGINIKGLGVDASANLLTPKTLEMLRAKYPGQYARGGVVPGAIGEPQPAIVHGGETIIPAGKRAGINVTITGNTFVGEKDFAEKIGDILFRQLQLNART